MSQKWPEDYLVAPSYGQKRAQKRPDWVSAQFQAKFGPIMTDFGQLTKKKRSIAQNVRNGLPVLPSQRFSGNSPVAPSYGQNTDDQGGVQIQMAVRIYNRGQRTRPTLSPDRIPESADQP